MKFIAIFVVYLAIGSIRGTVGDGAGGLTAALGELTKALEPLSDDETAPIPPKYVFEDVIGAIKEVFEPIEKAVVGLNVSEAYGLVDVVVNNVKTAIVVNIQYIGSITLDNLRLGGAANGISAHLNVSFFQLMANVQMAIDAIKYFLAKVKLDAKAAESLKNIVAALVAVSQTVFGEFRKLLPALKDAVNGDADDIIDILSAALFNITTSLNPNDSTSPLGKSLKKLGATDGGSRRSLFDVLFGILKSAAGTLRENLSGLTTGFSSLTSGLDGIVSVGGEDAPVGSLADLLTGLNSNALDALDALAGNVEKSFQTLNVASSLLDVK